MNQLLPVIDWFLKDGSRYGDSDFLDRLDGNNSWVALVRSDLCNIHFRRTQIFVANFPHLGIDILLDDFESRPTENFESITIDYSPTANADIHPIPRLQLGGYDLAHFVAGCETL